MARSILGFVRFVFNYHGRRIDQTMFYLSMVCACIVVAHIGYLDKSDNHGISEQVVLWIFYTLFSVELLIVSLSFLVDRRFNRSRYASIVVLSYFLFVVLARNIEIHFLDFLYNMEWVYFGVAIVFISELSKNSLFLDNFYFNPTILFVVSFLALICLGAVLLMLPRATTTAPMSFVNAFFMATSAVCITGLSVVDISTDLSLFGKTVVLILIQVGGLGIMTFTGFFGYFFSGGFSFKNQLMYGEILEERKLNSVVSTLLKIIFITLLFEFIGGVLIYLSLNDELFKSVGERMFFAAFHTVSAFCNAGFSILEGNIGNTTYRYNYNFQIVLTFMFLIGGLGFGTVYNFYTYVKSKVAAFLNKYILHKPHVHRPQVFSFNSKFVLVCNLIIVLLATVSFFCLEKSHALESDGSLLGEWSTSFFMANSARSAGFNSMDINFLSAPTLIMFITLMWIGTSPGSTGGGVKVTTVAIAFLNIIALAKGKENIEIYKRTIASESVKKAFAIIILSIVTISFSFILLNFSEPSVSMKDLLFESVSAYSTSGLSLGLTPLLSSTGKIILIFTMFVGRVGTLTLLVAFIKNTRNKSYIYPTEKILF